MGICCSVGALAFVGLGGCQRDAKHYVQWVRNPKNGLVVKAEKGGVVFTLQYKPLDYLALMETNGAKMSEADFNGVKDRYRGMEYYNLNISTVDKKKDVLNEGIGNPGDYFQRANYISFELQRDLGMVVGKDTFPCKLYHFERTYNATEYRTFVLAFENKEQNRDRDKTC